MSQFDQLLAAAAMPNLLQVQGDTVYYRAAGSGEWLQLTAICEHSEEEPAEDERHYAETERELLWITCYRDPTRSQGGIAAPRQGDSLRRAEDREDEPWAFQSKVNQSDAETWRLLFARNRPTRYGR